MRDCIRNVEEKADARTQGKLLLIAISIDMVAFDILKNQIRKTSLGHTGINEFRDVGMCETPQNAALAFEPVLIAMADERSVKEFHRYLPFEAPIASFGQPHAPHSALSDRRNQRIRSNRLPRRTCRFFWRSDHGLLHEPSSYQREMVPQERFQIGGQPGILCCQ